MITLGLDMASKKSGYSLFYDKELVEYGLWEIPNAEEIDWRNRIIWMSNQLNNYINKHKIDKIFIEDVPLRMENPQTLKILSALSIAGTFDFSSKMTPSLYLFYPSIFIFYVV